MIFSTIANVLAEKVLPLPSHAEIVAKHAKETAAAESKERATLDKLAAQATEARAETRTAITLIEQANEAALHRASVTISKDVRGALVPLLAVYRRQPSRPDAAKIAAVIKEHNARSIEAQGAALDHFVLATAWVQALIENGEGEDLRAIFFEQDSYSGGIVEAATALFRAATERSISEIEDALFALESATDAKIRTAPRSYATDDAQAAFAELIRHSHAGLRSKAAAEFSRSTADSRQAKWAAEYRAPASVDSNGAESRVRHSAPAVVTDEEGNVSAVERLDPHFERLAERDVDFARLVQP